MSLVRDRRLPAETNPDMRDVAGLMLPQGTMECLHACLPAARKHNDALFP